MMPIKSLAPRIKVASISTLKPQPESYGQGRGGRPWMRLRATILNRDKYLCQCEDCRKQGRTTQADEVDHIIPLCEGGTDNPSNLRAINHDCHMVKTRAESARARGSIPARR